jgi:hypothetical protein
MEQTSNNLLPVINTEILKNLPDTLVENSALADRAVATVTETIAPLKAIDLTTVDATTMEAHDLTLTGLQTRLKDAYTIMNNGRSPFTKLFDEIKSKFTAEEKKVVAIGEEVKALRDGWQKEKARRNEIARKEAEAKQQASAALIEAKTYFAKHIVDRFSTTAVQTIQRMHSKFYSLSAAELDSYAAGLKGWSGALDNDTWNTFLTGMINPKPQLLTGEQMQLLLNEVVSEQKPKLSGEWKDRMTCERDGLVELVPSRKMELERIAGDEAAKKEADDRIAQEQKEREELAKREREDRESALETNAEFEKVNAAFDAAAEGGNVVSLAKGTSVKRKYVPKSHAAWVAIIQSWVTNDMAKMTVDELGKKLSFMKTACEGRLNKGEELKAAGLEIEEDYSTRVSRSKAKEVA